MLRVGCTSMMKNILRLKLVSNQNLTANIQRMKDTNTFTHFYLCYPPQWKELEYVHTRKNRYAETLEDMEVFVREF